jgi:hypothetical protein
MQGDHDHSDQALEGDQRKEEKQPDVMQQLMKK